MSSEVPFVIETQAWQVLSGCAVGPAAQFTDFARIRAIEVLARSARTGKEGRPDGPSALDRVRERPHDRLLADDFVEGLGPVLAVQRGHRSIQSDRDPVGTHWQNMMKNPNTLICTLSFVGVSCRAIIERERSVP